MDLIKAIDVLQWQLPAHLEGVDNFSQLAFEHGSLLQLVHCALAAGYWHHSEFRVIDDAPDAIGLDVYEAGHKIMQIFIASEESKGPVHYSLFHHTDWNACRNVTLSEAVSLLQQWESQ